MDKRERIEDVEDLSEYTRDGLEDLVRRMDEVVLDKEDEIEILNDNIDKLKKRIEELTKEIEKMKMSSVIEDSEKAYLNGKADAYYKTLHDVIPVIVGMLTGENE